MKETLINDRMSSLQKDVARKVAWEGGGLLLFSKPNKIYDTGTTGDLADQAQRHIDYFNKVALWNINQEIILQGIHAQKRIIKGLDAICENCGRHIPEARLQANRRATRCIACQEEYERTGKYWR